MPGRPVDRPPGGEALAEDPLSTVLRDLRIAGVAYAYARMAAPWGLDLPPDGAARLHVVVEGAAWLQVEGEPPRPLAVGDAVFLPRGAPHVLRSGAEACVTGIDRKALHCIGERVYRYDGCVTPDVVLASCSVRFNEPCLHPILDLMPKVLVAPAGQTDPALQPLLAAMADEVLEPKLGGATVLARLADVVITRLIRAWVQSAEAEADGWMGALRDPRIGKALAAIHADPARDWSAAELARAAGLSRSLFVERFSRSVGVPPVRYATRLRMTLAKRMLSEQRLGIAAVASRLGYRSVPAFSRAFKRYVGRPPGHVRREATA